jgi:cation:H+ antiporter
VTLKAARKSLFNVLFIIGACAAMKPLVVHRQLVRLEVPIMIAASVLLMALSWDGKLGRLDGMLLFLGITVYTVWGIRRSRKEEALAAGTGASGSAASEKPQKTARRIAAPVGYVLAGLALLVLGARWLVNSAIQLAAAMGVSDVVIGLTIVAAGTSLPEVFTSLVATPGGLGAAPPIINFDMEVMLAVAVACLPVFFTGYSIARWEGALFLGCYIAYTAYLIMDATGHDALPAFSHVMLMFVLPLLAVTILVFALNSLRPSRRGNQR